MSELVRVEPQSRTAAAPQSKYGGATILGAAILLWGANWPAMKLGLAHITPLWLSAMRFASGALCLFAVQAVTGTLRIPKRGDLPFLASVGALQMLAFTALSAIALHRVGAGRSAVLAYTTPIWVTPVSVLVFRERLSRRTALGTTLGIAGVLLLFNPLDVDWHDHRAVLANVMLLAASLCWAVCILHLRHFRSESSAYVLAPWQMLVAAVPLVVLAVIVEGRYTGDGSIALTSALLYIGPIATAFCFCAVNAANTRMSSTSMATAMLGVPVFGLFTAVLFLHEPLTPALATSDVLIVAGIALSITRR
ncbi:DMT family transporter [Burkholderia sp. AU19243]|uniref:Multidrug DMT transporter n=1 Tax=Burkholderia latens TaxID=488446 RepID=A0AAP1C3D1_9BURK|nr:MULTISPECIES: DMT family transporter [Burkholderia]AIO37657.1 eamA-like transporter family protein [Burkholderia cenocepacia]KVA00553.1 multidrug DMT transporter [Burkholderia latens]MBR8145865.1 DMT family transporter [Burkholderia vietnamiensis]MBR8367177.1 DMT family transporter [Burkholderia sp. AU19243]